MVSAGRLGQFLARILRGPMRARRATIAVTGAHARILRASAGRVRRSWLFAAGQPVMVLTTIGRRSGTRQTTPVTAFACEDRLAAAGMNLGMERRPGWAYNLQENGEAWVTISGRTVAVQARMSDGPERERLWTRWTELQPSADAFARLAGREIPIFVFEPRTEQIAGDLASSQNPDS
jgi:deazaflavin-dependent oxidoreductase (nitroreductase family)